MKRILIVSLMLVAVLACSCVMSRIEGSGNVTTEVREVSGFEQVALSNMGRVVLTQGDTEGLSVRADDNLMQYIVTEVRDGTLRIGLTSKASLGLLRPTEQIVFDVTLRELSGLSVSGSGSIESERLHTEFLDMSVTGSGGIDVGELTATELRSSISGSGHVRIGGEARAQVISVSGSGRYGAQDLVTRDCDVSVSGSGLVTVHATDFLDVRISGSGSVKYLGQPEVTKSISGSGRLASAESSDTEL